MTTDNVGPHDRPVMHPDGSITLPPNPWQTAATWADYNWRDIAKDYRLTRVPWLVFNLIATATETPEAVPDDSVVVDVPVLVAEVERLREIADAARLLGPARAVLDQAAEDYHDRRCADMAQRIVDVIGHSVTDEPPHAIVERDELRAEVERLRAALDAVRALHKCARRAPHPPSVLSDRCAWDGDRYPCATVRDMDAALGVQS